MKTLLTLLALASSSVAQAGQIWPPYQVGQKWAYDVVCTAANCPNGEKAFSTAVVSEQFLGGKHAFKIVTTFGSWAQESWSISQDDVFLSFDETLGTWKTWDPTPIVDNRTWIHEGKTTYTWRKIGPYTVKAGTFVDCWKLESMDELITDGYSIACKDVGTILSYGHTATYDYRMELSAFTK
jgi:hypothetical protein